MIYAIQARIFCISINPRYIFIRLMLDRMDTKILIYLNTWLLHHQKTDWMDGGKHKMVNKKYKSR